jgi:hypothetical protein
MEATKSCFVEPEMLELYMQHLTDEGSNSSKLLRYRGATNKLIYFLLSQNIINPTIENVEDFLSIQRSLHTESTVKTSVSVVLRHFFSWLEAEGFYQNILANKVICFYENNQVRLVEPQKRGERELRDAVESIVDTSAATERVEDREAQPVREKETQIRISASEKGNAVVTFDSGLRLEVLAGSTYDFTIRQTADNPEIVLKGSTREVA